MECSAIDSEAKRKVAKGKTATCLVVDIEVGMIAYYRLDVLILVSDMMRASSPSTYGGKEMLGKVKLLIASLPQSRNKYISGYPVVIQHIFPTYIQ